MTLPYPHEAETGQLKPIESTPPEPLDIERRVGGLIVPDAPYVNIAGQRLRVCAARTADSEAERVRGALTRRLLERRPNADEKTWEKFAGAVRAALSQHQELDDAALEQALLVIDGL